ncbi:MAG TPA: exosortase U [Pirellulaceae bacterium]|nr:exosortase U [Pirellulaceae bacterium]HMO92967.1 exosortase U [Pirellulaceae bacterium]HMP68468.1 exosortase U [Pirellulaceae bacterium]
MFKNPWYYVLAAVIMGFAPLLIPFFRGQWTRTEYQAFPLLIAAIGFFLVIRWHNATPVDRGSKLVTLLAWFATLSAFVNLGLAMFFYSPWLAMIAFVFFAAAFALTLRQHWQVPGLLGIWLLTCLLVPPPLDRDRMFVTKLQLFSSSFTSNILDGVGIKHLLRGNIFQLPDRDLFVDQACSGIVSLVSIITCIGVYCVFQRRSLFHWLILIAFGIVWTVFMNSMRLAVIAMSWSWYHIDLVVGLPHFGLALIMFALSAVVVFVFDRFLEELLSPIDIEWRENDPTSKKTGVLLIKCWNWFIASRRTKEAGNEVEELHGNDRGGDDLFEFVPESHHAARRNSFLGVASPVGWPVLGLLALAGMAQILFVAPSEAKLQAAIRSAVARAIQLDREFDPARGTELRLVDFQIESRKKYDAWGQYSCAYSYQDPSGPVYLVSLDFPFGPHWHDLRECYTGAGWKISEENFFVLPVELDETAIPRLGARTQASGWEADSFLCIRPQENTSQFVTHAAFYSDGKIFNRPRGGSLFIDFITHVTKGRDRQEQADYFQVQVVAKGRERLTREQREVAIQLIGVVVDRFRRHVAGIDNH